jgi:hypothetical protein
MGVSLPLIGSAVGIGSSLAGMFGGGGNGAQNVQMPQGYQFGNLGGADQGAYSGVGGLSQYNVPGQLMGQYGNIAQSAVNNPYAQQYQAGSNQAGATGYGAGQQIAGGSLSMMPDVQALLSLGFDPQNALYSKLQQQNQDQTNAQLGMSGVATTPYGAGVANQSNQNFNLGWQQQELQRAMQGAQGAGGLMQNIGQGVNTGVGQMQAGAGLPYNTFQGINTNALGVLGQQGAFGQQAAQLPQTQIQDYLAYLGAGTGQQNANTALFGQGLNQSNMAFGQQQTLGSNLGSSLAGFGKAYGNTGWGSPSSWFGGSGGAGGSGDPLAGSG